MKVDRKELAAKVQKLMQGRNLPHMSQLSFDECLERALTAVRQMSQELQELREHNRKILGE